MVIISGSAGVVVAGTVSVVVVISGSVDGVITGTVTIVVVDVVDVEVGDVVVVVDDWATFLVGAEQPTNTIVRNTDLNMFFISSPFD